MEFYIYKDTNGEWRWYLQAANGKKIANAGEGYKNKDDCMFAIDLVIDTSKNTPVHNLNP